MTPRPTWLLPCCLTLLLAACASTPRVPDNPDWARHQATLAALQHWSLSGRLNVRQQNQSDTVQINWQQQDEGFELRLSSSLLGLGAVYVHGTPTLVTLERSGKDSVTLPGLDALTQEYFGYAFPAAQLLYWIRGLPAPGLPATTTLDPNQHLASLQQRDPEGRDWQLDFDRYQAFDGFWLPGRIRAQHGDLRLTFSIHRWQVPAAQAAAAAGS